MEGTNDNFSNEFNKEFMCLYEICTITKQKIYIGKYILNHSELFRASRKCRLIIVDALFHSSSINLCKITDVTEEINVISFGKNTGRNPVNKIRMIGKDSNRRRKT